MNDTVFTTKLEKAHTKKVLKFYIKEQNAFYTWAWLAQLLAGETNINTKIKLCSFCLVSVCPCAAGFQFSLCSISKVYFTCKHVQKTNCEKYWLFVKHANAAFLCHKVLLL